MEARAGAAMVQAEAEDLVVAQGRAEELVQTEAEDLVETDLVGVAYLSAAATAGA